MVKKCDVILNNELVTVVRYENINIQFPSIRKKAKSVFVVYEDGNYMIVNKDYKQKSASNTLRKSTKKKTTNKKIAKEVELSEEIKDA